ncbi:MAG: D-alanyl-D-alanine carboxypeptidase family protein [Actinomycetota bacterium]
MRAALANTRAGMAAILLCLAVTSTPARAQTTPLAPAAPPPAPATGAASSILFDLDTGSVFAMKSAEATRPPASLTKILTGLVVLQQLPVDELVTIVDADVQTYGTRVGVVPGETFSVEQLLEGLLMASGNDVALALARAAGQGDASRFVQMMNDEAARLGATATRVTNASGLDHPSHRTSARDLAIFTRQAMANPVFARIVATKRSSITHKNGKVQEIANHNKLLTRYPQATGIKTGWTETAGHCLAASATRDGRRLAIVVLGDNSADMYRDSENLLSYGFANYAYLSTHPVGSVNPPKRSPPAATRSTQSGGGDEVAGEDAEPRVAKRPSATSHGGSPVSPWWLFAALPVAVILRRRQVVRRRARRRDARRAAAGLDPVRQLARMTRGTQLK